MLIEVDRLFCFEHSKLICLELDVPDDKERAKSDLVFHIEGMTPIRVSYNSEISAWEDMLAIQEKVNLAYQKCDPTERPDENQATAQAGEVGDE